MNKLSASALSDFLKSPKRFYWRYVARVVPIQLSVNNFDHDKLFGSLWAEFVDNFYKGLGEVENTTAIMTKWHEQADSWIPEKMKAVKTKALEILMPQYYQDFSPDDGVRSAGSELWIENDRFVAKLDGLSTDGIVHEVKSTSRAPNLTEQLWKVQNSLQAKLYAVLTQAEGVCIEFAWKDSPYGLCRAPTVAVTADQRRRWEQELNNLADYVYSLGADQNNYLCNSECVLVTKNFVGTCPYQPLCSGEMTAEMIPMFYRPRSDAHRGRT